MNEVQSQSFGDETLSEFEVNAAKWLAEAVPERWRENRGSLTPGESDAIRREWDKKLFEGGYAGISLPSEYGGQGLGLAEEVGFSVLAGRAQAPDGFGRVAKTLVAPMLINSGTEEQKTKYLQPLISGEEVWCQGFSEPGAGSDLASIRTRAEKVDGGWRISGRKTWTTFAQHADYCFALAQTDTNAPRYRNLGMFIIPMNQDGVTIHDIKQISGAIHFAEVHFDQTFVSDEYLIGAPGEGWKIAMNVLQEERGGSETAARYVEIRADVDLLLSMCNGDSELRREINDLDVRTELLRWQLLKVVDLEEAGGSAFERAVSILKVLWSELWQDVTNLGVKVTNVNNRGHWRYQYLESKAVSIYSGTNEIQRNIVSERVLGLPR